MKTFELTKKVVPAVLILVLATIVIVNVGLQAQPAHFEWLRSAGERICRDEGRGVATDAAGNAFITGQFVKKITLDKVKFTNPKGNINNTDIFVAKYNTHGKVSWAKQITGVADDYTRSIAVDGSGNSFVAGYYYSATLKSGTSSITNGGSADMFLAKYNAAGTPQWLRGGGGTGMDSAFVVAVDNAGNAYIAGTFQSPTITFGATTLTNHSILDPTGTRYNDIFMVKYSPNGDVVWAQSYGDSTQEEARDIRIDASGNIYFCGTFSSSNVMIDTAKLLWHGGIHPSGVPYPDIFIAKLNPSLGVYWTRTIGFTRADVPWGFGFDNTGNTYVAGSFESDSVRLDSLTKFDNAGYKDILLTKYDPDGAFLWSKTAGGFYSEEGVSLGVDGSGNCYLGGYYESPSLTIGTTTLTNGSTPESKIFLAKYSTNGNVIWVKTDNTVSGIERLYKLVIDGAGTLYFTGAYTSKNMSFEGKYIINSNQSYGWEDEYLVKLYEPAIIPTKLFRTFTQSDLAVAAVKTKTLTPTFGNARDTTFLYAYPTISSKNDPSYPGGMVLGIARNDSPKAYGWVRFTLKGKTVQDFLPHTSTARGFDLQGVKPFIKELKNPKGTKYNNKLAGNLAVLKINMMASMHHVIPEGVCDLVFNHPSYPSHMFNGKSLWEISTFVDTMLTKYKIFYSGTPSAIYDSAAKWLDSINTAFSGPIGFQTQSPIRLTGVKQLGDVAFLQQPAAFIDFASQGLSNPSNSVEAFSLAQNYPNPFNPSTTLSFVISQSSMVSLKVYDVLGREVATLLDNSLVEGGTYQMTFDGSSLASGIYFYRLEGTYLNDGTTFSDIKRMLLMK